MIRGRPFARRAPVGGAAGAAAPSTPLTIISSVPVLAWFRGDLGITIATGVAAWANQQAGQPTFDMNQGTGGLQPSFNATGGPNSTPIVTGAGVSPFLLSPYTPVAPATTNLFFWLIFRRDVASIGNEAIVTASGASTNRFSVRHSTGNVGAINGTALTVAMAATVWRRAEVNWTGSVADYLKIGSTQNGPGVTMGNNAATGALSMFATSTGVLPGASSIAELVITQGAPTELAALNTYCDTRYGAGLT